MAKQRPRRNTMYIHADTTTSTHPRLVSASASEGEPSPDLSYYTSDPPSSTLQHPDPHRYTYTLFPPPFQTTGDTQAAETERRKGFEAEISPVGSENSASSRYSPVSPVEDGNVYTWETQPQGKSQVQSQQHSHSQQESRSDSNATLWPHYSPTSPPMCKPKSSWWRQGHSANVSRGPQVASGEAPPKPKGRGWYRSAKGIYIEGPDGEGQQVWDAYRHFRREKQERVEEVRRRAMDMSSRAEGVSDAPQTTQAAIPSIAYSQVARSSDAGKHEHAESKHQSTQTGPRPSLGEVSRTSREVPVVIDSRNVRGHVDVNKPLPSRPRQHVDLNKPLPAHVRQPKDLNKPLPALPSMYPAPLRQPQASADKDHMVGIAAAGIQFPTKWEGDANSRLGKPMQTGDSSSTWWHSIAEKRALKTHEALKAKISCPQPLVSSAEAHTANIAADCGGVGGPAAATSQRYGAHLTPEACRKENQVRKTSPLGVEMSNKFKQKASDPVPPGHWRDKIDTLVTSAGRTMATMGTRSRNSDASFACVGLPEGNAAVYPVQGPGPSKHNPILREGSNRDTRDEHGVPEPLFRGMQGGRGATRDTGFYQPYHDVIGEYRH
ncbi:hypothetical protein IQ07DRAFT_356235 [Pyrenochaeta sp. DS3sAY3a]|nr:hypothetical protein IQ07DRAFT_356235 [Pyrenochaeta sp. DS3sAY3a]